MGKFGSKMTMYFFLIEGSIYCCFIIFDLTRQENFLSGILKFISIFICALYVWFTKNAMNEKKHRIMKLVYLFIMIADIFLLFTPFYFYGVMAFSIVQMLYWYYLQEQDKNGFYKQGVIRLCIFGSFLFVLFYLKFQLDALILLVLFYFTQFLCNIGMAIMRCRKDRKLFLIGLILFFLCDINVGIFQSSSYMNNEILQNFYFISSVAMWFFYLPGQVLLAYSSISEK